MEKKIFQYKNENITFEFSDGNKMINATEMAKPFDKLVGSFLRLKSTKDYILLLESRYADMHNGSNRGVLRVIQGGNEKELQGTWMDEKLALKFAAWLSPLFELWVYDRIEELLKTGTTSIPSRGANIIKSLRMVLDVMEEHEMRIDKHDVRLDSIEDFVFELEAKITSHDENYYMIAGYCSLNGLPCELEQAQKWGRAATILSKKKGFDVGSAHSEKYGTVGTYHKEILNEILKV